VACLVLSLSVVTMDLFILLVPYTKELSPDHGKGSEDPGGPRVGLGMNIVLPEKQVLTYTPLGSGMPIKQMSPAYFRLFMYQLVIASGVTVDVHRLKSKP